ncbi:hypothetical protein P280DRAFT_467641, partial [Massarina eburnea CBS 473.64]
MTGPPSFSDLARKNDTVTIEVGPEPETQRFHVYTALLTYYSDYFAKTLSGDWKEAQDRTITLPDIDPRIFSIFVDWLYTKRLPVKSKDWIPLVGSFATLEESSSEHNRLVDILRTHTYVFADRFMVPGFRCAVHNDIANDLTLAGNTPFYDMVILAFDNLPAKNKLLTLLVKMHCAHWKPRCDRKNKGEISRRKELPYEFLLRAMILYGKIKENADLSLTGLRSCHDHVDQEEKNACSGCAGTDDDEGEDFGGDDEEEEVEEVKEAQPDAETQSTSEPSINTEVQGEREAHQDTEAVQPDVERDQPETVVQGTDEAQDEAEALDEQQPIEATEVVAAGQIEDVPQDPVITALTQEPEVAEASQPVRDSREVI